MTKRRPHWLKVRLSQGGGFNQVKSIVEKNKLHTVCQSARCPNIWECWGRRTATFLILGDICTRSCGFCAVKTGRPEELDLEEPERIAQSVRKLSLKHVVITSVNRDELKDGGASIFAETIRGIRSAVPGCRIEVLIPDFKGSEEALRTVLDADPDILGHNVETVPRLYRQVRPQAKYDRSLKLLWRAKMSDAFTKSGLMLGLGETLDEVREVMHDLRNVGCDVLTLGQYLQPTREHLPISHYISPEEFEKLKSGGQELGFRYVESGPLVRSSYHADEQIDSLSYGKG